MEDRTYPADVGTVLVKKEFDPPFRDCPVFVRQYLIIDKEAPLRRVAALRLRHEGRFLLTGVTFQLGQRGPRGIVRRVKTCAFHFLSERPGSTFILPDIPLAGNCTDIVVQIVSAETTDRVFLFGKTVRTCYCPVPDTTDQFNFAGEPPLR